MQLLPKILTQTILILAVVFPTFAYAEYGIYYGMSATYAKRTAQAFDRMIVEPYNISLYSMYTGKKICYLSVGEFAGTPTELDALRLTSAQVGYNSTWNTYIMDMGNTTWQKYLLASAQKIRSLGCNGLFLDTIWQDGQETGAIAIVRALRAQWPSAYIIPNNAHNIKTQIVASVDGYMFENFWEKTIKTGSADANWLTTQMQEYQTLNKKYNKRLFGIVYGDPFANQTWSNTTKNLALKYGFDMIYANTALSTIYGYLDRVVQTVKKLP